MAWDKNKVNQIKESATGGVVQSLISGGSNKKSPAEVLKNRNYRCVDKLYDDFGYYCRMKNSDISKQLVAYMQKCVEEYADKIEEFKKLQD